MKDKEVIKEKGVNLPLFILLILGLIIIILSASFIYFALNGKDYTDFYLAKKISGELQNPLTKYGAEVRIISINTAEGEKRIIIKSDDFGNVTDREIEKELINYMGIYLKLYNLHEIPFTSITPKIQVYLENNPYLIEISKGDIILDEKISDNPDIIIRTTYEEIFKMMENENYAKESILLEKTSVEIVANKFILFSKGYLTLYNELEQFFTGYILRKI